MLLPSTKLEAVNTLLSVIGEAPVNQLDSGIDEAVAADQVLTEVSRRVQTMGWSFNEEPNATMTLDSEGRASLPANCLRIDGEGKRYVNRGGKLYDKINRSYTFSVPPVLTYYVGLEFSELPEAARTYITLSAARVFQAREVGSVTLHKLNGMDEASALQMLKEFELESDDLSYFDAPDLQLGLDRSPTSFIDYPAGTIFGVS